MIAARPKQCVLYLLVLCTALAFGTGCGKREPASQEVAEQEPAESPRQLSPQESADRKQVIEGNNRFALDLYARLRNQEGNLFFSPASISTALAMTWTGARGDTAEQMAKTLHFPFDQERVHPAFGSLLRELDGKRQGYQLTVANALWGQQGFNFLPAFRQVTKDHYRAGFREVDFISDTETARKSINAWVEKKTQDKIKELLKPGMLDGDTRLVLTNAIYFKGDWERKFKKEDTREEPFRGATKAVKVPMMRQGGTFGYLKGDGFQALELPYVGKELSMVILLPDKADGLAEFEKSLTSENLSKWLPLMHETKVSEVMIPKFKDTVAFELSNTLEDMGMPDAFSAGKADFSGMTGKRDLSIYTVVHKAFVEVNEEGTEAAAATGVGWKATAEMREIVFRADHPFVFLIRDKRLDSVLFLGRLVSP